MKLLMIGNCQAMGMVKLIKAMCVDISIDYLQLLPSTYESMKSGLTDFNSFNWGDHDINTLMSECDLIFIQSGEKIFNFFQQRFPDTSHKIRFFPNIIFNAFHPDMLYITDKGKQLPSPTGCYHSSIACFGWLNDFTVEETLSLFCEDVFKALGFFDYWQVSVNYLVKQGEASNLPLDKMIESWSKRDIWMHTINHPKVFVLADVARALLGREKIPFVPNIEENLGDTLANGPCWKAYPEIASRFGFEGQYQFKNRGRITSKNVGELLFGLEDFVRASFELFATYSKEGFNCPRLVSKKYDEMSEFLKNQPLQKGMPLSITAINKLSQSDIDSSHPYKGLHDYQFWRRAIERVPLYEVDPVMKPRFKLDRESKVATAGSCFAQHISRALGKNGFNYYVSEKDTSLLSEEYNERNYGVFSARFGNIYTTSQLLQLFDRVYGNFDPIEKYWLRSDGKLVDPFRPQIEPDGFLNIAELEKSRIEHFAAVRKMFENLDVLVFTLGLTETWRHKVDGAVYPLAPGVVAGKMKPTIYEFVNFGISQVVNDMQVFINKLVRVNPQAKIILTVSPVPLIATYENRHVLVSNTYSKSVLRVAAEVIIKRNTCCDYFPSYEIITGNYTKGEYFEDDLRSIKKEGVDHVMRLFLKHYTNQQESTFDEDLINENLQVSQVFCDEDVLDRK